MLRFLQRAHIGFQSFIDSLFPRPLLPLLNDIGVNSDSNQVNSRNSISSLLDALAPIWFAVPKKKVTKSRKRHGLVNYSVKNLQNIMWCKRCQKPKLLHKYCANLHLCAMREEDYVEWKKINGTKPPAEPIVEQTVVKGRQTNEAKYRKRQAKWGTPMV